jgi:hypothetical protein
MNGKGCLDGAAAGLWPALGPALEILAPLGSTDR